MAPRRTTAIEYRINLSRSCTIGNELDGLVTSIYLSSKHGLFTQDGCQHNIKRNCDFSIKKIP
ncbi:hypothetical protein R3W88_004343 [Solanum pinnatisectum]|uniref:Uncharacterized protein n=1 Tax=Solanum pinnatisectum TaxID=50273 RepID=A0AAV9KAY7_9SOLN|nr:hypothetical protein R3W88_004343 [Solanum pinnatisectum]